MSGLSFATPWLLAALAVLPMLWWLLKVVPPSPKRQSFPAIALLAGLVTAQRAAARTPLWLMLLRLALAAALILAAAHPLMNALPPAANGPLLLVLDDGWAAAPVWSKLQDRAETLLNAAEREGQPVRLLLTSAAEDNQPPRLQGPMTAAKAKSLLDAAKPHPWPTSRGEAAKALADAPNGLHAVWLSDGLEDGGAAALAEALKAHGGLEILKPKTLPLALLPPDPAAVDLTPRLMRGDGTPSAIIIATDSAGRELARAEARFEQGETLASVPLPMPSELRNRVERLSVENGASAASLLLLDPRWQRRPAGLARDGAASSSPLLDDQFYLDKALSPLTEVRRGSALDLLKREMSLLVLPDEGTPPAAELSALKAWIEKGGVLVRLAGPKLAHDPDDLLPVTLRGGGRTLGGAMSWTHPMALGPMPANGPFAGLEIPEDLRVRSQLLAEPSLELDGKTWARLEDGTPLVTGQRMGKGWLVLIHTTVWPDWSDLGLSGLLPQMMKRLLDLAQGVGGTASDHPLKPKSLMDGFGHLAEPGPTAEPLPPKAEDIQPGPKHPPGLYGDESGVKALNLSASLSALKPLPLEVEELDAPLPERDLRPLFLQAALCLLLLDMMALLLLRQGWRRLIPFGLGLLLLLPGQGHAAEDASLKAALQPRLAYLLTGDAALDTTSKSGLTALSRLIERRTTADLGDPVGVSPERDPLALYPLLYWPVPQHPQAPSALAREKINDFLRHGGMILFDSRDGGQSGPEPLRLMTEGLDIPPLAPVTPDHVLTHSFYILRDLPGRLQGSPVYVAAGEAAAYDGVSPVVIGANDWAAAWATDNSGQPSFAVVPGGEAQREQAYRFGVNLVMYALTGNYKSDQVHLPAIMERLRR